VLPLSKGQLAPTGEPALMPPGCEPPTIDNAPMPPGGPTPAPTDGHQALPRLSPTSGKPSDERYGSGDAVGAVRPAHYLAPPLQMPGSGS
jgi:hypothetical protein